MVLCAVPPRPPEALARDGPFTARDHHNYAREALREQISCLGFGTLRSARDAMVLDVATSRASGLDTPRCATERAWIAGAHILTRGSKVIDMPTSRVGIIKSLSHSHAKVDFDEGTELVVNDNLAAWTVAWDKGKDMACLAAPAALHYVSRPPPQRSKRTLVPHQVRHVRCARFDPSLSTQLRSFLKARFGTLLRAWHELDTEGQDALEYKAFTRALKRVGFPGNVKYTWEALFCDNDDDGLRSDGLSWVCEVTFAHLHPKGHALLQIFWNVFEFWRTYFRSPCPKLPCLQDFWNLFNYEYSGYCRIEHFQHVCATALHWSDRQESSGVFKLIAADRCTIADFQLLMPSHAKQQVPHDRNAGAVTRRSRVPNEKKMRKEFQSYLRQKYGSLVHAWHVGLDTDNDGTLAFGDFCAACRRIGWRTHVGAVWRALQKSRKGAIALRDLDPDVAKAFDVFENFLLATGHDYLENAWDTLDVEGNGRITATEFSAALEKSGWKDRGMVVKARELFQYMDVERSNSITIRHLRAAIDLPPKMEITYGYH